MFSRTLATSGVILVWTGIVGALIALRYGRTAEVGFYMIWTGVGCSLAGIGAIFWEDK